MFEPLKKKVSPLICWLPWIFFSLKTEKREIIINNGDIINMPLLFLQVWMFMKVGVGVMDRRTTYVCQLQPLLYKKGVRLWWVCLCMGEHDVDPMSFIILLNIGSILLIEKYSSLVEVASLHILVPVLIQFIICYCFSRYKQRKILLLWIGVFSTIKFYHFPFYCLFLLFCKCKLFLDIQLGMYPCHFLVVSV